MVREKIDGLIATAMKERDNKVLGVYKLIKSDLVKAEKDGVEMTDANEIKILSKMRAQREDSIKQYTEGGREDLAEQEKFELGVISELMPKQPTEAEVIQSTLTAIHQYQNEKGNDYVMSMKDMKPILTAVQSEYPAASGKTVSAVMKGYIVKKG